MKGAKRAVTVVALLALGFLGLLGGEILLARRGADLDPFPEGALDGRIGSGPDPLRVTWIGDSTGDGVGATTPDATLPRTFARGIGRPVILTVLAQSGARVADAIESQLPRLAASRADWVIVGVGSNDVVHLTRRSRFRKQLGVLLDGVTSTRPDRVILIGPGQFAATPRFAQPLRFIAGRRARVLNHDARRIAIERKILYVDIIERVGGEFVRDPERFHARDHFHPNDEGYALWARATLDALAGMPRL